MVAKQKFPEVSVVMPCLNEEEGIGNSIKKAKEAIKKHKLSAEIVVADNGSTDNSVKIAKKLGARVVFQKEKGYGSAYLKGLAAAKGEYIIIGDSDDTYDFREINKFISPLKKGYDLVIGSRFRGKILPGAMSWSHRYLGNPILSAMIRLMFGINISDSQCGMRAFTKEVFKKLELKTTGMEFASEMLVKALEKKMKIFEVPIRYYPRKGKSKLSGVKDAWRHIRFLLMYSPNHLFLIPGFIILVFGFFGLVRLFFGPFYFLGHGFDVHSMILSSLLLILGLQIVINGLHAKIFAYTQGYQKKSKTLRLLFKYFNLERGIALGGLLIFLGILINLLVFVFWAKKGFGELQAVRPMILANTILIVGFQTFFSSFLFSIMGVNAKK